jgi:hypothetical protein
MAETATIVVLVAGTGTFANEWYQTGQVNWRVPIATMLGAAVVDGIAKIDDKAALALSIMVLLAAVTTKFNGKSIIDTISTTLGAATKQPAKPTTLRRVA